nr:MAG TPA: Z DNA-binding protein [Caudoviricetes sp.]
MPNIRSKYSPELTQRWTAKAMIVLVEAQRDMTCKEIQQGDLDLVGVTPQKMARILNELVDKGLVMKSKGKSGLMHYKAMGTILKEGYVPAEMVY